MPDRSYRDLTILVLYATALGVIDSLVPRPVPFMKLGLANAAAVIAVVRYGFLKTLELNLLRVFAVALITGLLATPTFLLSVTGAVTSAVAMGSMRFVFGDRLSCAGVSVAGAVASLWMQLVVARIVLPGLPLQNIVLLLTLWGIISGAVTGLIAQTAVYRRRKTEVLHKDEC
ncbi:MAG: Gx transporter family protein [Candidatus Fermentibacteraceae bacterium]|nr:Gx transporter family protein [Candidatus Fermentibacteraceae bacterium]